MYSEDILSEDILCDDILCIVETFLCIVLTFKYTVAIVCVREFVEIWVIVETFWHLLSSLNKIYFVLQL